MHEEMQTWPDTDPVLYAHVTAYFDSMDMIFDNMALQLLLLLIKLLLHELYLIIVWLYYAGHVYTTGHILQLLLKYWYYPLAESYYNTSHLTLYSRSSADNTPL